MKYLNLLKKKLPYIKRDFASNHKKYQQLYAKFPPKNTINFALQILSTDKELEALIFTAYDLDKTIPYSNSELLKIIIGVDYGKLFIAAITKVDFDLQTVKLVDTFVQKYQDLLREKEALQNTCKTVTKKYVNKETLDADSNKEIYVDPEFDKKKN